MKMFAAGVFLLLCATAQAQAQDNQFKYTGLRFFESGKETPDVKAREYKTEFLRSKTRYINCELSGSNLLYRKRAQTISYVFRRYKVDGTFLRDVPETLEIPDDWPSFLHTDGWGWAKPGNWKGGSYKVEVLVNDSKVGEGTFTIVDDIENRPPFAATPEENFRIIKERRAIGDAEGARQYCAKLIADWPNFALLPQVYAFSSLLCLDQFDLDGAIRDATRAIELDAKCVEAYNHRAKAYRLLARTDDALADYNRSLELDGGQAECFENRAMCRKIKKDMDGAMADLDRAIKLNPKFADALNDRGQLRADTGDLDGAIEDYTKAIEADVTSPFPHEHRGDIYMKRGLRYKALLDLEAAVTLSENVCPTAAGLLGDLGIEDAAPVLAKLLNSWDSETRRKAVWSLGRLDARAYASQIVPLLEDENANVRGGAAIALGEMDAKESEEALAVLLEDKDPIARIHAVFTLCRFGLREYAPNALEGLKDKNAHVRGDSVEALGMLGDSKYAKDIVPMLEDRDASVRVRAIVALERFDARQHAKQIARLLGDSAKGHMYYPDKRDWLDAVVKENAARVLGKWGIDPEEARPAVVRGDEKLEKDEYQASLDEYDRAIAEDPKDARALDGRASARALLGDLAGSAADLTQCIELGRSVGWMTYRRGCVRYNNREWAAALKDFKEAKELDPQWAWPLLRIYLTRVQLKQRELAVKEFKEYLEGRTVSDDLFAKIGLFLLNELPEADLFKAAESENAETAAENKFLTLWAAGMKASLDGDAAKARGFFEQCVPAGSKRIYVTVDALAELAAMKK